MTLAQWSSRLGLLAGGVSLSAAALWLVKWVRHGRVEGFALGMAIILGFTGLLWLKVASEQQKRGL